MYECYKNIYKNIYSYEIVHGKKFILMTSGNFECNKKAEEIKLKECN